MLTAAGAEVHELAADEARGGVPLRPRRHARSPRRRDLDRRAGVPLRRPAPAAARPAGCSCSGGAPDGADISADATRQALDGIVRSLAKELQPRRHRQPALGSTDDGVAGVGAAVLPVRASRPTSTASRCGSAPARPPRPTTGSSPLAGKTALVTGAARGIGAAIAGVLARDGAHVIAADLSQAGEALAKVANRIGGTTLHLDVAAPEAPERLLTHLAAHTDGLDILVHNAGITRDKLMANMKPEQWDSVIAVNLESQLRVNAALLDSDQLRDQARVVCLSSTTGLSGNRGQTNYGATKAGVIGLVRSSAAAFAGHGGSTINAIAPGFIDTEMTAKMPFATREVARRLSACSRPACRSTSPRRSPGWLARRRRRERAGAAGMRPEPGRGLTWPVND